MGRRNVFQTVEIFITVVKSRFSSGRNTLWEVFEERQSNRARRRQRDKRGDRFRGRREYNRKKIPGISARSWKDILILATATDWTTAL